MISHQIHKHRSVDVTSCGYLTIRPIWVVNTVFCRLKFYEYKSLKDEEMRITIWSWIVCDYVCTCRNTYLCICDYTVLTEASMVEDNTQQEKPKNKFSSELRLFLLMPNVESILWISLLLFIAVGQFFIKFFFLNVLSF